MNVNKKPNPPDKPRGLGPKNIEGSIHATEFISNKNHQKYFLSSFKFKNVPACLLAITDPRIPSNAFPMFPNKTIDQSSKKYFN